MREIKFRAWDTGLKEMIPVHDIQFHDPITRQIDGISLKPKGIQPTIINRRTTWRQVHPDDAILMQYTGLKDKNGVEIYEGDIVSVPTWPFDPSNGDDPYTFFPIVFEYGQFKIGDNYICEHDLENEVEVIGNIYENPDLL